jgi:hypothetical protein
MSKYSQACSSRLVSAVNSNEPGKEYNITKNAVTALQQKQQPYPVTPEDGQLGQNM